MLNTSAAPHLPLASAPKKQGCQVSWLISAILATGAIKREEGKKEKKFKGIIGVMN